MRKRLKRMGGEQRHTFTAIVPKFSLKSGYRGLPLRTIMLKHVKYNGVVVADHVWLTCGRGFYSAFPIVGDLIQFDARVREYEKGYKGKRSDVYNPIVKDYGLSYPTRIKVLQRNYKKIKAS